MGNEQSNSNLHQFSPRPTLRDSGYSNSAQSSGPIELRDFQQQQQASNNNIKRKSNIGLRLSGNFSESQTNGSEKRQSKDSLSRLSSSNRGSGLRLLRISGHSIADFESFSAFTDEIFGVSRSSLQNAEANDVRSCIEEVIKAQKEPDFTGKLPLPIYIDSRSLPTTLPKTSCVTFRINFHFGEIWTKTLKFPIDTTLGNFKAKCNENIKLFNPKCILRNSEILFKVNGVSEYIIGNDSVPLYSFECVRQFCDGSSDKWIELNCFHFSASSVKDPSEVIGYNASLNIDFHPTPAIYSSASNNTSKTNSKENQFISSFDLTSKYFGLTLKKLIIKKDELLKILLDKDVVVLVAAQLYNGPRRPFGAAMTTEEPKRLGQMTVFDNPRSSQLCSEDVTISDLSRETTLLLKIIVSKLSDNTDVASDPIVVGWTRLKLFDHRAVYRSGSLVCKLWEGSPDNPPMIMENPDPKAAELEIEFDKENLPIVFPVGMTRQIEHSKPPALLHHLLHKFYFGDIPSNEQLLFWNYRKELAKTTDSDMVLVKVLRSCDWNDYSKKQEMLELLKTWKPFKDPFLALELLDIDFHDSDVRKAVIPYLDKFSDDELCNVMLQLVESLKFELDHLSPVACYLLHRGALSPHKVGHRMFWAMHSQLWDDRVRERFILLLENFLKATSSEHRAMLATEVSFMQEIEKIAWKIVNETSKTTPEELTTLLRSYLANLKLPKKFTTPLDAKKQLCGIMVGESKVMGSKKRPLKLVLQNADPLGEPFTVLFKVGDDLRQDELTLQIFRVMDSMWRKAGLDLHLTCYGCVSTSREVGILEWVPNSTTIANITQGILNQMHSHPIYDYIKKTTKTEEQLTIAKENFKRSVAAYLVSTYVLGIGDRHDDNIMINGYSGHLFHIDFGHFLGHYKKYLGVQRETTPFVFTSAYAHVLGGADSEGGSQHYLNLQELTGRAYNVLRANAYSIDLLFRLMVNAGIPELSSLKDIEWIDEKLMLTLSDEEATRHFNDLFLESLNNKMQTINAIAHYVRWKYLK